MIKHRNRKEIPIELRFFKHTRKTPSCWVWTASTNQWGYGRLGYGRRNNPKKIAAHRLSWSIHNGTIPEGKLVLHKCDNRKCVNPKHLYLGTSQDNSNDMVRKKRHMFGESHNRAKLTIEQVKEIRELCHSGIRQVDIGNAYGISQFAVSLINRRINWRLI